MDRDDGLRREIIWRNDQKTLAQCSLLSEVESESAGDALL